MDKKNNHFELHTSEIFQRMDARDARQAKLNSLLAVISVAAVIMAGLSIVATFFIVFS